MELEVSRKVREAIKAKLLELGCHVDDELPDYIMILIANRRSNNEIENDLSLFLTENTKKFVIWLTHVLKKLEEVTAAEQPKKERKKKDGSDKEKKKDDDKDDERNKKGKDNDKDKKLKRKHSDEKEEGNHKDDQTDKLNVSLESVSSSITQTEPSPKRKRISLQRNDPIKSHVASKDSAVSSISDADVLNLSAPDDLNAAPDTLIVDAGENEFNDNLEELRRIALESQAKKRKMMEESLARKPHQRSLITNILKSCVGESSPIEGRSMPSRNSLRSSADSRPTRSIERRQSSSSRDSRRHDRRSRSPDRDRHSSNSRHREHERMQEKSNYISSSRRRIGSSSSKQRSMSRSRSRSPVRKITSTIGSVIRRSRSRSRSESPVSHSLSSVVKVTERPKRDLQINNKMLLRAVAAAQQSIIRTDQMGPKFKSDVVHSSSDTYDAEPGLGCNYDTNVGIITNRRFTDFPEVTTSDFYEPTEAGIRRKSIKERLGVRREPYRSIRDRLGDRSIEPFIAASPLEFPEYDTEKFSPTDDYKILINVNDEAMHMNGKQRNVVLAASDTKRISIQVNNSDDSSEESNDSDEEDSPTKPAEKPEVISPTKEKEQSDIEFQVGIGDEDKLPELPAHVHDSEHEEVVYEEVVEEFEDSNQSNGAVEKAENSGKPSSFQPLSLFQEPNFAIRFNKATLPSSLLIRPTLPDLRGSILNKSKPPVPFMSMGGAPIHNGAPGTKCKFWPKCQFKDKCIYEHPKCKFSPCKNKDCVYKHDPSEIASQPAKVVCKYYPKCTSMNCKYHHPSPCRFGVGCTDTRCENYHPGTTIGIQKLQAKGIMVLPAANQLKWVKK